MATFAQIQLTFNSDLTAGEYLTFSFGLGTITENWVTKRIAPNQAVIGTPTEIDGERSAISFVDAIELDYTYLQVEITRADNVVTIAATDPEYQFSFDGGEPVADVTPVIDNTTETPLTIDSITFTTADTDPDENVKVNIETNIAIAKMTSPIEIDPVSSNPFDFDYPRGTKIKLVLETSGGQMVEEIVELPSALTAAGISIEQIQTPEGTTIVVSSDTNTETILEYSLDGVTYQSSSSFPGLPEGGQTVYVRDQFGIVRTVDIDIQFGAVSPYFQISKSNSFRMANRITHGDCGNYKNEENTLSCEENVPKPYTEIQQFQSCDIITTQFRSNYPQVTANVHIVDGNSVIGVSGMEQITENIDRKDRRDCFKFTLPDGRLGIYFTSGNLYDWTTGVDIGDYVLNGALPEWGIVGNYLHINGSWKLIQNIVFDDDRDAEVLVVNDTVPVSGDVLTQVRSRYNREEYEIYEFTIDLVSYLGQKIQVEIRNFDSSVNGWETISYKSEIIDVQVRHADTVEIQYWGRENTDIYYGTGIRHKIRIPLFEIPKALPGSEIEINKGDNDANLLKSTQYEYIEYQLGPVTTGVMRKLCQALVHTDILFDGVECLGESIDTEGPLEDTNLYIVKAKMLKSRDVYNSDSGPGALGQGSLEIPAIVDGGTNYIKYQ